MKVQSSTHCAQGSLSPAYLKNENPGRKGEEDRQPGYREVQVFWDVSTRDVEGLLKWLQETTQNQLSLSRDNVQASLIPREQAEAPQPRNPWKVSIEWPLFKGKKGKEAMKAKVGRSL